MRSKTVLISMAVIIALSLGLIPLVNLATSQTLTYGSGVGVMEFYAAGEYHFLAYSSNTYGQPVAGTPLNLTFSGSGAPPSSSAVTNSSGFARWTTQAGPPGAQQSFVFQVSGQTVVQGTLSHPSSAGDVNFFGGGSTRFVVDAANSSQTDLLFFYEGPNGTLPTMYTVYYNYSSTQGSGAPDRAHMKFLGSPTTFVTIFKLPPPPRGTTTTTVGAFDTAGNPIAVFSSTSQSIGGGGFSPPSPQDLFTAFTASILALVVPLMAILVAYNSYGKDRANGVLESVLARPVTRRGLGLSRYLSMVISISVAITITMGVMEVISQVLLGKILSPTFALTTVGALDVEAAAFIGITMLISQALKSTGGVIGIGIGLWVVLDFFWGLLIFLGAYLLGVQVGSGNYLGLTIDSSFLNPAQFYSLVGQYLSGATITTSGTSTPISPATYGLTPFTLVAAAAFWVLVPLGSFLYLAVRRD
jgi:ABC-type transport system involved in multi-copper enzyme maturation permease subunit